MHATLQVSLRAALRGHRDVESIGPFLAAFDADDDSPFRNYAIPDEGAQPTAAEIECLRQVFARRTALRAWSFCRRQLPQPRRHCSKPASSPKTGCRS